MDTRSRLWAAINSHVVNCGGHPDLKPHELVHGEEWGREHIEVIEGFIKELEAQRELLSKRHANRATRKKRTQWV